jgi:hypothetical protein
MSAILDTNSFDILAAALYYVRCGKWILYWCTGQLYAYSDAEFLITPIQKSVLCCSLTPVLLPGVPLS